MCTETGRCRSCGHADLKPVLSLGDLPLPNALLTEAQLAEPEPTYPLDVVFCEACGLLQLRDTVDPAAMFTDYAYLSSFSDTVVDNGRENAEMMIAARGLGPESLAVEIGSNDGYLLQFYAQRGVRVLGIDPAANAAEAAAERDVPTVCEFFDADVAQRLRDTGCRADVIHGNNVFAHVADLNGVVAGFRTLLKSTGVVVIQVPYARDMIEGVEFDTIYHEHLCYFTLTPLVALFARHGLELFDVEHLPIHGGTLRLYVRHQTPFAGASATLRRMLAAEKADGVDTLAYYTDFAGRVERLKAGLRQMLHNLHAAGKRIVGYAASAKGAILLNTCGIDGKWLDYVVDRSTVKQGRHMPGSHLRIEPPERVLADMPDVALLLAWNHADEILARETEYTRRGGRFLVPVPQPHLWPERAT